MSSTLTTLSFHRSIDQLEGDLVRVFGELDEKEWETLELVREYEIRQGYRPWGLSSTAEWLCLKCGVSLGTAREKVRVALALFDRPAWSAALRAGEVSYSKVRAMTRVVDADEAALLEYAKAATAAQVEAHCRQLRNANRRESTADANRAYGRRWLSGAEGDDMVHISCDLPKETGRLVMLAIERAAAMLAQEARPALDGAEDETATDADGFFARQADALVAVAQAFLSGGEALSSNHYQVVVHVDESALRDEGGRADLPVDTVRRLLCDGSVMAVVDDERGQPLYHGRKRRVLPPQERKLVAERDGTCRYPGCANTRFLEPHHVKLWSDGGETKAENTLMLCSHHHRLCHEGGFTVLKAHTGEWYFRTAHGRVLADQPFSRPQLSPAHATDPSRDGWIEEPRAMYGGQRSARIRAPVFRPDG